ncbi:MAG: hypothetical protein QXL98_01450 [Thermofilaceae archaeon]
MLLAIVAAVPVLWLLLFQVYTAVAAFFSELFPASFEGNRGAAADFQAAVWFFLPVIIIVASLVWSVMETLKERRREEVIA